MIGKLQLIINGKEVVVPLDLSPDLVNQIYAAKTADHPLTGWEAPEADSEFPYYYEDALGRIQTLESNEDTRAQLDLLYSKANCFANKAIAKDLARGDLLLRQLRRFSVINRKNPIDYEMGGGWTITYNYQDNCLECGVTGNWKALGDVVFDTEETARQAINEYAEELIWYFTQMRESL